MRVAGILNDMAISVTRQGEYERAIALFDRTLAIREELLAPDHREIAESLANLGFAHDAAGHYRLARDYTARAIVIMEAAEGPSHPFVIGMRNNLAISSMRLGDYEESRRQFATVIAAATNQKVISLTPFKAVVVLIAKNSVSCLSSYHILHRTANPTGADTP